MLTTLLIIREILVLFKSLELSIYSVATRTKENSYQLPPQIETTKTIFPIVSQNLLFFNSKFSQCSIFDINNLSMLSFQFPFMSVQFEKIEQIFIKDNNFVFLSDDNQILFGKIIRGSQIEKENRNLLNNQFLSDDFKFIIDLTISFEKNHIKDFTVNSLGNIIMILFTNGKCKFLDIDILKSNYDTKNPEYILEGSSFPVKILPGDILAKTSGFISSDIYKKTSKFKIEYFQKNLNKTQSEEKEDLKE